MSLLGINLTLLIGPTIAVPAPPMLSEAIDSVEVTHSDEGRSGFQVTFRAGRGGPLGLLDYPLMLNPLLRPFNRVVLIITINAFPRVLIDGIITNQQLAPGVGPGEGRLTVTGEDISLMLDQAERSAEHPAQDETIIATKIILSYARYGLIPLVIPPLVLAPPLPVERVPVQQGTDLQYLRDLAARHGYVFYITPGPAPLTNTAYWGPAIRVGLPQPALTVNMGYASNVESLDVQYNALAPTMVDGEVQDPRLGQTLPVHTFLSTRLPLAGQPAWLTNYPYLRHTQFRESGVDIVQAYGRAQAQADASNDQVVTVSGTLDVLRYGSLLQPRGLVGLRGAGYSYDGFYYVKRVSHSIRHGEYKQQFTLTREGLGALLPVVRP